MCMGSLFVLICSLLQVSDFILPALRCVSENHSGCSGADKGPYILQPGCREDGQCTFLKKVSLVFLIVFLVFSCLSLPPSQPNRIS